MALRYRRSVHHNFSLAQFTLALLLGRSTNSYSSCCTLPEGRSTSPGRWGWGLAFSPRARVPHRGVKSTSPTEGKSCAYCRIISRNYGIRTFVAPLLESIKYIACYKCLAKQKRERKKNLLWLVIIMADFSESQFQNARNSPTELRIWNLEWMFRAHIDGC